MKKIFCLILALLAISTAFVSCAPEDEEAPLRILGAWRWTNVPNETALVFSFAENGHVLMLNEVSGEVAQARAAHYYFEDDTLYIREHGKETGVSTVKFIDDDTMEMSAGEKGFLTFQREEAVASPIVGNWWYQYVENGELYSAQYAFTATMDMAKATYRDEVMIDYKSLYYMYTGETLAIYDETVGTAGEGITYRVAFPYKGYMTMESTEKSGDDEVNRIDVLMRIGDEK